MPVFAGFLYDPAIYNRRRISAYCRSLPLIGKVSAFRQRGFSRALLPSSRRFLRPFLASPPDQIRRSEQFAANLAPVPRQLTKRPKRPVAGRLNRLWGSKRIGRRRYGVGA